MCRIARVAWSDEKEKEILAERVDKTVQMAYDKTNVKYTRCKQMYNLIMEATE